MPKYTMNPNITIPSHPPPEAPLPPPTHSVASDPASDPIPPTLPIVTVIGSLNNDLIIRTPRIPEPGETLTADSFEVGLGGKGANQAVACMRLSRINPRRSHGGPFGPPPATAEQPQMDPDAFMDVLMVGAVGNDPYGRDLIQSLSHDGIDCTGIDVIADAATGIATILVDSRTGENRILLAPNANRCLTAVDLEHVPLKDHPVLVVMQLEIPLDTVLRIIESAVKASIPVLLNAAPAVVLPAKAYQGIDHLIVNETEAAILMDRESDRVDVDREALDEVAAYFQARGVKYLVVTLGARGAYYADLVAAGTGMATRGIMPAVRVANVVDTTAAGDTFVGGYAVTVARARANGYTFQIREAVAFSVGAAAKTVQGKGAQASIPWLDEVLRADQQAEVEASQAGG